MGGLRAHALNSPERMLGPARRGFLARFEREARDAAEARGEHVTPEELAIRAERLRTAYMLDLAAKSAAARRARKAGHVAERVPNRLDKPSADEAWADRVAREVEYLERRAHQ